MNKQLKGRMGEDRAAGFLEKKGYTILKRNYRCREGEIDVIAKKKGELIFIEVKNWDALQAASLEYSIDYQKRRRILRTSKYFLFKNPNWQNHRVRFDVILVQKNLTQLNHIENAFNGV